MTNSERFAALRAELEKAKGGMTRLRRENIRLVSNNHNIAHHRDRLKEHLAGARESLAQVLGCDPIKNRWQGVVEENVRLKESNARLAGRLATISEYLGPFRLAASAHDIAEAVLALVHGDEAYDDETKMRHAAEDETAALRQQRDHALEKLRIRQIEYDAAAASLKKTHVELKNALHWKDKYEAELASIGRELGDKYVVDADGSYPDAIRTVLAELAEAKAGGSYSEDTQAEFESYRRLIGELEANLVGERQTREHFQEQAAYLEKELEKQHRLNMQYRDGERTAIDRKQEHVEQLNAVRKALGAWSKSKSPAADVTRMRRDMKASVDRCIAASNADLERRRKAEGALREIRATIPEVADLSPVTREIRNITDLTLGPPSNYRQG